MLTLQNCFGLPNHGSAAALTTSKEWVIKAVIGVLICACLIGAHVIDLEIAELSDWMIKNQPSCFYNDDWDFAIQSSWLNGLCFVSYVGIILVVFVYLALLVGHVTVVYVSLFLYGIIIILHQIFTIAICGYFWNTWLNSKCGGEITADIYAMYITSTLLIIPAMCGCICLYTMTLSNEE